MKQYKYIGNDPQKKGWIATKTGDIYTVGCDIRCMSTMSELIEGEPTLRQEVKEDVFEKIYEEIGEVFSVEVIERAIQKHLGISRDEINECFTSGSYVDTRPKIEKLFEDRGLLIE